MIKALLMTKTEAANALGVSVRTLQRMTGRGEIAVAYTRGKKGDEASYDEAEVERVRDALRTKTYVSRANTEPSSLPATRRDTEEAQLVHSLIERLALLPAGAIASPAAPVHTISLGDKLTLTLAEASALAGLSRRYLLDAIKAKQLKAAKRGRGWNIKKSDLDKYIRSL
jgi:excisionase family DNA binding protein